jgi:hypothetical protein
MWNTHGEDFWRSPFRKELLRIGAAWGVVMLVFSLAIAALFVWSLRWRDGEWQVSLPLLAFVATFVWANLAWLKSSRAVRDLNAVITWHFLSGPRPEDPDESMVVVPAKCLRHACHGRWHALVRNRHAPARRPTCRTIPTVPPLPRAARRVCCFF